MTPSTKAIIKQLKNSTKKQQVIMKKCYLTLMLFYVDKQLQMEEGKETAMTKVFFKGI
ncbi:hypothetical protein HHSLTHF2_23880 [Vreelandella venusta]|uniref:Uncharacterized protein n=1 Tax=Halomonas hydrothermalis TaxID=115561 RepID=A0A6F8U4L0_9GAMM|nr:hypothetical protein HHSLTHF2_23880 [Halomonas hydrothermalis]